LPQLSGQRRARKTVKSEAALGRARVRATLDAEHAVLFLAANGNHVFGLRSAWPWNADQGESVDPYESKSLKDLTSSTRTQHKAAIPIGRE
jgi:hypothetical protein